MKMEWEKILDVVGKHIGHYIHPMVFTEIVKELNFLVFYVTTESPRHCDYGKNRSGSVGTMRLWSEEPENTLGHFDISSQSRKFILDSNRSATDLYEYVIKKISAEFDLVETKEFNLDISKRDICIGVSRLYKFRRKMK